MDTLTHGAHGPEVGVLQDHLYTLGYDLHRTGTYDTDTSKSVQSFRVDRWHEAGSPDCEQYTYDAIAYVVDQRGLDSEAPPPGSQDPQSKAVVHHDGTVIAHVKPREVNRAGAISPLEAPSMLVDGLDSLLPGTEAAAKLALAKLRAELVEWAASTGNATIAVGLDGDLAVYVGGTAGVGIYASAGGATGLYESFGIDIGAFEGATLGVAVTIVDGGPDRLAGPSMAVEASVDVGFGFSAGIMYSPIDGSFMGVTVEASIGEGVGIYASLSNTWLMDG